MRNLGRAESNRASLTGKPQYLHKWSVYDSEAVGPADRSPFLFARAGIKSAHFLIWML